MNPKIGTRLCFVLNTLLFSTTSIFAQGGDFQKQMLKGSMKEMMKEMMNEHVKPRSIKNDTLNTKFGKETINLEIDPEKIRIPIYSSYKYRQDSLKNKSLKELAEKKELVISPNFFKPYTNEELPFDYYYDTTPVFTDGKWIAKSALPLGGISPMTIVALLFATGIIKDDPLPATKSRKEKALERLREVYGSGMDDKKWDGDVNKLNDAINKLREEFIKEGKTPVEQKTWRKQQEK